MLHLRLRVPSELIEKVEELLREDPTAVNLLVVPDAYVKPEGWLVMADVARENAQHVIAALRDLDLPRHGSIAISEADTILADAADAAEKAAPGSPIDGVVWDLIEDRTRDDIRLSWAFVVFLTLATLIASIGRILDEPILIVGAMVVGPEFAPVAAICFALARPRLSLLPRAVGTLLLGFLIATTLASVIWAVVYAAGGFEVSQLTTGPHTDFIVKPDVWSFVIALLAGVAGIVSLTTSKSSTLVGVFISVTTVPAVGTLSLSFATGTWHDAWASIAQLSINLAGLVLAGTITLLVQRAAWVRVLRTKWSGRPRSLSQTR